MKKYTFIVTVVITLLFGVNIVYAAFTAAQLGTSAANGDILSTNGFQNTWISPGSLTFTESQISDLGDYLTGNETITLSGDASGSGATSIAVTVANDSHSHTGSTLSGISIASDTDLSGNSEIVLTGAALSIASSIARDTELHAAVTLTGEDYLTLATQQITMNAIDPDNLAAADFGDWTCNGSVCSLDADTVSDSEMDYSTVTLNDFTFDVGSVSKTEFGYLDNVTSAIQTQFTGKQNADADLTTYAGITPSANIQTLLGAADYSAMRTQLSLVPGTNVQAYDADLTTYAGITPSANVQTYLGAANYAAMRTQLSLGSVALLSAIDMSDNTNWSGGRSLTTSGDSMDADAELYTGEKSLVLETPTTADDAIIQWKASLAITITEVACSINAGTSVTVQFDERTATTPNTSGTDILTSQLVADTDEQLTTSFSNAGIAAGALISLDVDAVSGSVGVLRCHLKFTYDD